MDTELHELTAGYALDALDPEERRAYEAHLPECERCRQELASFWKTSEALAVAASGPAPPPELRKRILDGTRAERRTVVPLRPRRGRAIPALAAAAAVAAVVALALGLWGRSVSSDLDGTRAALERAQAATAVLANPSARSVSFQPGAAGRGRLVVDPDGNAVLVVDGLGPAPAGKTYELWVVPHGGAPKPAGLFPGRDGAIVAPVDGTVSPGEFVLVTIEPESGVDAPTSEPILGTMPL